MTGARLRRNWPGSASRLSPAGHGTPADPAAYDYQRAARDALHFAALFDRFIQNLRRFLGYEVQYFAAVEPQRRLAPHIHLAIRGTVSRAELRRVLAATYHQVWWPDISVGRFEDGALPVWDENAASNLDPATGEVLPTWDDALDAIGDEDEPLHVSRFGERFDAQGVLAGSKDAARCIGYLTKYLTKQVADCHQAQTDAQQTHVERLVDALRFEPCSPRCANWLRYGIQPKSARPGLIPGAWGGGMTREAERRVGKRLLTVSEVAAILSTCERFPRRLIAERRIRFVRVGRHVRIPESALREFIAAGLVEPVTTTKKKEAA